MPAPPALDNARTGTPDGSSGIQIATVVVQEGTFEAPAGIALTDRLAAGLTPDRNDISAVDTATDMSTTDFAGSSGANLFAINNRGAIVVWCTFDDAVASATVRLIYYDGSNNPLFVGPPLTFTALAQRISSSGHYMTEPQIVESYGASKCRPYLVTLGSGNVADIFAHPI
jgi:hypothetical protein